MALTQVNDRQLDLSSVDQTPKFIGNVELESATPHIQIDNSSVADTLGLYRLRILNGVFQVLKNRAAAGDFSDAEAALTVGDNTTNGEYVQVRGALRLNAGDDAGTPHIHFNGSTTAANVSDGSSLFRDSGDNRIHFTPSGSTSEVLAYISDFVVSEIPTGLINDSNTVFTLANTPRTGTEQVYLNGLRQDEGGSDDYTISGDTITFNTAPATGDKLVVDYIK